MRLQIMTPVVKELIANTSESEASYKTLVIDAFDKLAVSSITDVKSGSLQLMYQIMSLPATRSTLIAQLLKSKLLVSLPTHIQISVITKMLNEYHDDQESLNLLKTMHLSSDLAAELFATISMNMTPSHGAQKNKKIKQIIEKPSDDWISRRRYVVEILEWIVQSKPSPSIPLTRATFDLLQVCVDQHAEGRESLDYVEQLLLDIVQSMSDKLNYADNAVAEVVRVDTLTQLLRTTTNPATTNQTLLIVSQIAASMPSKVLRNVMPLFTFMGSSHLSRDDQHSFDTVKKVS